MSEEQGRTSSPWYLKVLAVLLAFVMWLSGWVSAVWWYIDRHR
jgi:hypothetical protein